jgi:HSP20 family protein
MSEFHSDQQEWIIRVDQLQKQLDDYLAHLSTAKKPRALATSNWLPSIDVHETQDSVIIIAEVAGISADQLKAMVSGTTLLLSGRREPHPKLGQSRAHLLEIGAGHFTRTLDLPSPVLGSRARAQLNSGLLEITLPKTDRVKNAAVGISIRKTANRGRK